MLQFYAGLLRNDSQAMPTGIPSPSSHRCTLPSTLLVRIQRVHAHGVKWNTRVVVPMSTFAVHDIFAEPPSTPASNWRPAIVYYRAVAAGYHQGQTSHTGHYWTLVRGTEPAREGAAAQPGYRRCDDSVCTSGLELARGFQWEDAVASKRVALVALERVDGPLRRKSLSERVNELALSKRPSAGNTCPLCTFINTVTVRACVQCFTALKSNARGFLVWGIFLWIPLG